MVQKIFKGDFSHEILFKFLELYCEKIGKCYIFSQTAFEFAKKKGDVDKFCQTIRPFYYSSKLKYVDKVQKFTSFMTVIRQVCRYHQVGYTSKIKYIKSYYEIIYYIQKPEKFINDGTAVKASDTNDTNDNNEIIDKQ